MLRSFRDLPDVVLPRSFPHALPSATEQIAGWVLVALALVSVCLTAAGGFQYGFTHDDLMNTHWGLTRSWSALLTDIVQLWKVSPVYRPTGVAFLKAVHSAAGIDIVTWRALYGLLLFSMTAGTIAVGWQWTGRVATGGLAGLLLAFHRGLWPLYYGMGFVYDAVSYVMAAGALFCYRQARTGFPRLRAVWSAAAVSLFCAAMQAKESAVAVVVFVFLFEVLDGVPVSVRQLTGWLRERWLLWIMVACGITFATARLLDPQSVANHVEAYKVEVSFPAYVQHLGTWMQTLLGRPEDEGRSEKFGYGALAVTAILLVMARRNRLIQWGVLSFLLGVLPLAFIRQRGLETIVVPLLPLAIALAVIGEQLAAAVGRLAAPLRVLSPAWVSGVALCAVAGAVFLLQGGPGSRAAGPPFRDVDQMIMPALQDLRRLAPAPRPGERILIESDPFQEMDWGSCFLFRLYYRQPELDVRRVEHATPEELKAAGWRRLRWENGHWQERLQSTPGLPARQ